MIPNIVSNLNQYPATELTLDRSHSNQNLLTIIYTGVLRNRAMPTHTGRLLGITMTTLGGQTEKEPARTITIVLQLGSMSRKAYTVLLSAD